MSHLDPLDPVGPLGPGEVVRPDIPNLELPPVFDPTVPLDPEVETELPDLIEASVYHKNWALLTRLGVDIGTIETWDKALNRDRRVFVPIDVQAYVVGDDSTELTVSVTGGPDDPEPFAEGSIRPTGVHLHWALPDALLKGSAAADADSIDFPDLPDRWVVVRLLYPDGARQPLTLGWVVDSTEGSVTPLTAYAGTTATNDAVATFEQLDAQAGGSLHWTAGYEASLDRFAFHDPLDDEQVGNGAAFDFATYVVAGWATSPERDPLGPTKTDGVDLFHRLDELSWSATEIPEGEYRNRNEDLVRLQRNSVTPTDNTNPVVEVVSEGRRERFADVELKGFTKAIDAGADKIVVAPDPPSYSSLLHGFVAGVPIDGTVPSRIDDRPSSAAIDLAMGLDLNDVVAAWAADSWDLTGQRRRSVELLMSAFTTDLLDRMDSADGLRDIEEHDHAGSFWAFNGPPLSSSVDDRLINTDASPANPLSMGRKGRSARARSKGAIDRTTVEGATGRRGGSSARTKVALQWSDQAGGVIDERLVAKNDSAKEYLKQLQTVGTPESRRVPKPGPRYHRPQAPILAVRGCRPALRYQGDGMYEADGSLKVRYPSQLVDEVTGVGKGSDLVPSLGSGAIPTEVLAAVREAVLIDPYAKKWRAAVAAANSEQTGIDSNLIQQRLDAEALMLFAADGRYFGNAVGSIALGAGLDEAPGTGHDEAPAGGAWGQATANRPELQQAAAELARWSWTKGTPPSPVGVTTWRQPWAPLWIEWEVELQGRDSIAGWQLADLDLIPDPENGGASDGPQSDRVLKRFTGRSPLGRGAIKSLHSAVERWQANQTRRSVSLGYRHRRDLVNLEQFLNPLDMASASLDGIREQLLDINYVGGLTSGPDEDDRPPAGHNPHPLFSGRVVLRNLRLVDAFGRTLDVPVTQVDTTSKLQVPGEPAAIAMRPRLQHGSRLLLRLVDPAHQGDGSAAAEAYVDQLKPNEAVNPVVGFLLPDHIDEALEFFDISGNPLGQLSHHELTGAVRWEPAPGRPLPPSAGPLADLDAHTAIAGRVASGVVQADINTRSDVEGDPEGITAGPTTDSSLTALLRAVDTTMWTVNTQTAIGTSAVAGLVGRPIAVVRSILRLEIPDDLDEVVTASDDASKDRLAGFERLKDRRFPIRLGDLLRSDDSLLGYFVDDDYSRFHLVDASLVGQARDGGRHRGQLGLLGDVVAPSAKALDHPYVSDEDVLLARPGQTYRLTLLMLPAGKVHVTSGILPRKSIELHNEWIEPGLKRLIPSVRVGPVLVDPSEIRLPKINLLGDKQQFTRRTGPLTWRDDPIVAASQSALLPRMPHELQEGWVRIIEEVGDE